MRRTNWKTVSTLISMVVVAGCQENVVSPSTSLAVAPTTMSRAPQQRPSFDLANAAATANASADFTVGPNGGTFMVGNNAVYFPAHSICDPATSSYGIGSWDDSCSVLNGSIQIHAEAQVVNGVPTVDFTPALRFAPSSNPSRWVWLYMSIPGATPNADLSQYNILYVPTPGGPAYDETVSDPTLRTYVGVGVGLRRIKHFSGYALSSGDGCTDCGTPAATP
jgi:hypothetical protein